MSLIGLKLPAAGLGNASVVDTKVAASWAESGIHRSSLSGGVTATATLARSWWVRRPTCAFSVPAASEEPGIRPCRTHAGARHDKGARPQTMVPFRADVGVRSTVAREARYLISFQTLRFFLRSLSPNVAVIASC